MRINKAAISDALMPVEGTAQYDHDDPLLGFPVGDEHFDAKVHLVLQRRIVPGLAAWTPHQVKRLRDALSYALTFDRPFLDSLFMRVSMDFGFPEPRSTFFERLWDAVFAGEDWRLGGKSGDYEVVWDQNEIDDEWAARKADASDPYEWR